MAPTPLEYQAMEASRLARFLRTHVPDVWARLGVQGNGEELKITEVTIHCFFWNSGQKNNVCPSVRYCLAPRLSHACTCLPTYDAREQPTTNTKQQQVGDGNLNLVFIVEGPGETVVVKQALPYVRCVGESWPLTLDRAFYEHAALVEEHTCVVGWWPPPPPRLVYLCTRAATVLIV